MCKSVRTHSVGEIGRRVHSIASNLAASWKAVVVVTGFFTQNSPYPKEAAQDIVSEDDLPPSVLPAHQRPIHSTPPPCTHQTMFDHEHAA